MPMILILTLAIGPVAQFRVVGVVPHDYRVKDFVPDTAQLPRSEFLRMEKVREELKLTAAQSHRQDALEAQFIEKSQRLQGLVDREKALADLLKLRDGFESELLGVLEPGQKTRLDQIELQARGTAVFNREDLTRKLGLSAQKIREVRAIVAEGQKAMEQAAMVPLTFKNGAVPRGVDQVGTLVESPDFRASKRKAWAAVLEIRRRTLKQIESVLSDVQYETYQSLLGQSFDVESLWDDFLSRNARPEHELVQISQQLGLNLDQRSDPDFDTRVPRPAYSGSRHPLVLFDEAHHNFHTSGGRYKTFAELIVNDGYKIMPNRKPFTPASLAGSDILIIANALGAEGMRHPDAAKSAFTEAESDAVRDWVDAGGSLFLITDLPPLGEPAESLAKRFGVSMSKGLTSDPANQAERGLLFSRESGLIGDHAITRGRDDSERVDRVLTFGGQSLQGPAGSVPFLKFSETAFDRREGNLVPAAGRAQGLAITRGKGRVVVMGEAGQLAAQVFGLPTMPMGMNVPGSENRQMALNTMHWLSRLID